MNRVRTSRLSQRGAVSIRQKKRGAGARFRAAVLTVGILRSKELKLTSVRSNPAKPTKKERAELLKRKQKLETEIDELEIKVSKLNNKSDGLIEMTLEQLKVEQDRLEKIYTKTKLALEREERGTCFEAQNMLEDAERDVRRKLEKIDVLIRLHMKKIELNGAIRQLKTMGCLPKTQP